VHLTPIGHLTWLLLLLLLCRRPLRDHRVGSRTRQAKCLHVSYCIIHLGGSTRPFLTKQRRFQNLSR
jgi:hypothetical protein